MRSLLKLLCFTFLSVQLHAQNNKGTFTGKLTDTAGKNPIAFATITVFKAKDTSIVTYRLSDPNGNFKVPGLPLDVELRAVITSSGFGVYRKEFHFTSSQLQIDIGSLKMEPDIKTLDEVLVFLERPPVTVKNDTVEFNASAFNTLPQALVEDLLKKLPGVDVDVEGKITVNGRKVNRILVDGREFFGGDPKIATKNLPANLVDKVQVVDDKEELDNDPDINKADLGQIINLKLKKAIKKGWFGKAYVGKGGNNDRSHYESGAIINSFRDTFQVSVLGYGNNINKAGFGFNDLEQLGGFSRSGYSGVAIHNDGGIAINDVSFGGTGQGLQKSAGAGINLNHDPTKKLNINFQYFYGQIISDYISLSNSQQFFSDTTLVTRSSVTERNKSKNHRFAGKVMWKIDSMSTITIRPGLTLRNYNSGRNYFSNGSSSYNPKLNESDNKQRVESDDLSFTYDISYSRRFKKKGRSFFGSNSLSIGDVNNDQYNDVENVFYTGQPTVTTLNQNRQKRADNLRSQTQLNFTEPISKTLSLRFSNTFIYANDNDNIITYDLNPSSGKYEVLNDGLSNGLERTTVKNTGSVTLNWARKKFTLSPAINIYTIHIRNNYQKSTDIIQNYTYVFPSLNFTCAGLSLGYRAMISEPSAYNLQPVVDNTNPLYQNQGNPELVPTISHSLNAGYNKYDTKRLVNYYINIGMTVMDNTVVRERTVDQSGVQITRPVNVNGFWSVYNFGNYSKQFKFNNNWRFSLRLTYNLGYIKSYIIVNGNKGASNRFNIGPSLTWAFNWKDIFEFNQRYGINWSKTNNESEAYRDLNVLTHFATSEIIIRMPMNWVWESSIDYRHNPQVAPGFSKDVVRWNAGINYLFLRHKKGQLKLSAFDLLKQNTNAYRSVGENFITDVESNALTRYFMLSFTYNIRDFKGGKVGGRNNFFFF